MWDQAAFYEENCRLIWKETACSVVFGTLQSFGYLLLSGFLLIVEKLMLDKLLKSMNMSTYLHRESIFVCFKCLPFDLSFS